MDAGIPLLADTLSVYCHNYELAKAEFDSGEVLLGK